MEAYNERVRMPSIPIRYFVRTSRDLTDDTFVHPHWHDVVEVLDFMEGRARQQIGERIFTAGPGDIVIIWNNQIHSTYKLGREDCRIGVYQFAHHELWENEIIRRIGFTDAVGAGHPLWEPLHGMLQGISRELNNKPDGFEYQIKAYLYEFFATVIRSRDALPVTLLSAKSHRDTVARLFGYIDAHYGEPLTLQMAADAVFLSVPQFMRVIKNATGMTFKAYLNRYRINRATALLKEGATVAQAAEQCGFQNVDTFIRAFKRVKKCTPSFYKDC